MTGHDQAHATLLAFGYPHTVVRSFEHWVVLARPKQSTLGALVLVCKEEVEAFADISTAAFAEFGTVVQALESAARRFRAYNKINYLMLMMVDPHVHFHVLPRYPETQSFAGQDFPDPGWPTLPDLPAGPLLEGADLADLVAALKTAWTGD